MTQSVDGFLTLLARAFCSDALEQMAQHFTYPLPLYTKGELLVFGAPNALVEALSVYREAAREADIARVVPRVIASGLPCRGYSNQWVEWDHYDSTDRFVCTSQVRFAIFHDKMAPRPRIEMIDYTKFGFPQVKERLPLLQPA